MQKLISASGSIDWEGNEQLKSLVMEHIAFHCKTHGKIQVLSGEHKLSNSDIKQIIRAVTKALTCYDERFTGKEPAITNMVNWALTSQKDRQIYLRDEVHISDLSIDKRGYVNSRNFIKHTSGVPYKHQFREMLKSRGLK